MTTPRSIPDKFLVAFSFAGEQRDLVRSVAEAVEQRLGRGLVFFDEWYEYLIAGDDADLRLQEIYLQQTELVIPCVSERYGGKKWTKAEHQAIRALKMSLAESTNKQDSYRILPLRVGDGDVPGIFVNTIAPDIRGRAIDAIVELIVSRLKLVLPAPSPPDRPESLFLVPYPRNEFFAGREGELTELAERLEAQGGAVIGQAIAGLGGIGKTQTAVEFAYRHRDRYNAVLWLRAETVDELRIGVEGIARELKLPFDPANPDAARVAVLNWLETHPGWLLIFDNADTPELLKPYWVKNTGEKKGFTTETRRHGENTNVNLRDSVSPWCNAPVSLPCHILLTSRARVFSALHLRQPLEMPVFSQADAVEFFRGRLGTDAAAGELAEELGGLPLALEQAAAYCEQMQVSLPEYLAAFRTRSLELLDKSKPAVGDYPQSVATTWSLNFEQVQGKNPATAELLRISGWLAPDEIPFELWTNGIKGLRNSGLAVASCDFSQPLALNELLHPAARFSLLTIDPEKHTYKLHRLVQAVLRDEAFAEHAVRLAARAFPNAEFRIWPQCDRLVSHAWILAQHIFDFRFDFAEAALLTIRLGFYLKAHGLYAEAEPLYRQALDIFRKSLGEEHPDFAQSLNNLAVLLDSTGRYDEAEPLYRQTLEIRRKSLGEEHLDFAESLNNLAGLLDSTGRYDQAEPLYRQSLEILRKALGEEHPDFAQNLNNLAGLLDSTGRYDEAETLHRQALGIRRISLGEEHPDFAHSLWCLAVLLFNTDRLAEALPMQRRAVAIYRDSLGPQHPWTKTAEESLAAMEKAAS